LWSSFQLGPVPPLLEENADNEDMHLNLLIVGGGYGMGKLTGISSSTYKTFKGLPPPLVLITRHGFGRF
jgi:hypothetical protein